MDGIHLACVEICVLCWVISAHSYDCEGVVSCGQRAICLQATRVARKLHYGRRYCAGAPVIGPQVLAFAAMARP